MLENAVWRIGTRIGGGGFGEVYEAFNPAGEAAAAKFVVSLPASQREFSFENLAGAEHLTPVIDSGSHRGDW